MKIDKVTERYEDRPIFEKLFYMLPFLSGKQIYLDVMLSVLGSRYLFSPAPALKGPGSWEPFLGDLLAPASTK